MFKKIAVATMLFTSIAVADEAQKIMDYHTKAFAIADICGQRGLIEPNVHNMYNEQIMIELRDAVGDGYDRDYMMTSYKENSNEIYDSMQTMGSGVLLGWCDKINTFVERLQFNQSMDSRF